MADEMEDGAEATDTSLTPEVQELTERTFAEIEGQTGDGSDGGESSETSSGEAAAETPSPKVGVPVTAPAPETFEYGGKKYTLDQMVKDGVLKNVLATAGQFPDLQEKYKREQASREALERALVSRPEAQQSQAPAPAAQVKVSQAQIEAHYKDRIAKSVQEGFLDPDFAEAFPKFSAQSMLHMDLLTDVRNAVAVLVADAAERGRTHVFSEAVNTMRSRMDKVADSNPAYAGLKNEAERAGFENHLAQFAIPIDNVTEKFLAQQWVAYKATLEDGQPSPSLETAKAPVAVAPNRAKKVVKAPPKEAAGESTGTRSGGRQEAPDWQDLLEATGA
jgi:hypothetical protein